PPPLPHPGWGRVPPTAQGDHTAPTRTGPCRFRADFPAIRDTILSADGTCSRPPALRIVNYSRRLSQAISEGDGISLLVPVDAVDGARAAEQDGAEGIVVSRALDGLREATALPILWRTDGRTVSDGASLDACVLRVDSGDDALRQLHARLYELGLEPVI